MLNARLLFASLIAFSVAAPAFADEAKPDDTVEFNLAAEEWVTTKTAHVVLNVEAAVTAATAGSMRGEMVKAVSEVAKGDWRLVGFNRSQDQTGMDRWSASFDARLPESDLGGLAEAAKKASKAGMQVSVGAVDFSPTLEETEAVRSTLRTQLYKQTQEQLAALKAALPDKAYRIAQISFDSDNTAPQPRMMRSHIMPMMASMAGAGGSSDSSQPMERSEKITMTAHVVYAALPPVAAH